MTFYSPLRKPGFILLVSDIPIIAFVGNLSVASHMQTRVEGTWRAIWGELQLGFL